MYYITISDKGSVNIVYSTDTRIVIFVVKLAFEMSSVQQHLLSET